MSPPLSLCSWKPPSSACGRSDHSSEPAHAAPWRAASITAATHAGVCGVAIVRLGTPGLTRPYSLTTNVLVSAPAGTGPPRAMPPAEATTASFHMRTSS
eukprot:624647-Prymnesium_polylepis.1